MTRTDTLRHLGHIPQVTELLVLQDVLQVAEGLDQRDDLQAKVLAELDEVRDLLERVVSTVRRQLQSERGEV